MITLDKVYSLILEASIYDMEKTPRKRRPRAKVEGKPIKGRFNADILKDVDYSDETSLNQFVRTLVSNEGRDRTSPYYPIRQLVHFFDLQGGAEKTMWGADAKWTLGMLRKLEPRLENCVFTLRRAHKDLVKLIYGKDASAPKGHQLAIAVCNSVKGCIEAADTVVNKINKHKDTLMDSKVWTGDKTGKQLGLGKILMAYMMRREKLSAVIKKLETIAGNGYDPMSYTSTGKRIMDEAFKAGNQARKKETAVDAVFGIDTPKIIDVEEYVSKPGKCPALDVHGQTLIFTAGDDENFNDCFANDDYIYVGFLEDFNEYEDYVAQMESYEPDEDDEDDEDYEPDIYMESTNDEVINYLTDVLSISPDNIDRQDWSENATLSREGWPYHLCCCGFALVRAQALPDKIIKAFGTVYGSIIGEAFRAGNQARKQESAADTTEGSGIETVKGSPIQTFMDYYGISEPAAEIFYKAYNMIDTCDFEPEYATKWECLIMLAAMLAEDGNPAFMVSKLGYKSYQNYGSSNPYDFSWFEEPDDILDSYQNELKHNLKLMALFTEMVDICGSFDITPDKIWDRDFGNGEQDYFSL